MIIRHQNNVAGFAGALIRMWSLQPVIQEHQMIAVTPVVGGSTTQLLQIPTAMRGGFNSLQGGFST
jgi:hypothetical protein